MGIEREFENIDILIRTRTSTTGVDCFALAVIKMERQMRRLFTYTIYQFDCFSSADILQLREALVRQRAVYFDGFVRGFERIHPRSVAELVGPEHKALRPAVEQAIQYRNKIFHGQLTSDSLGTDDLLDVVTSIRAWCRVLGEGANAYMGYDGFSDSFFKATGRDFVAGYRVAVSSVEDYTAFLELNMKR